MSEIKKLEIVRFAPRNGEGFYDTLKKKVNAYFKDNNIDPHANASMVTKTVLILLMYLIPYAFMVSGIATNVVAFLGLWVLMGLGMVGVGCSIMHDSNHGSYSNNKTLNKLLGKVIILVGGYHVTWKIQHNILHHTYTNIEGLDHDIDAGIVLRFSPNSEWRSMHKFQHIYAWFLYGLLTLQWATIKDFRQVYNYHKLDLLKKERKTLGRALFEVALYKVFYYTIIMIVPIFITGMPWHWVVIGFVIMHFVAGLALSAIFQLAHVMEECEFPNPDDERKMKNNWAVHQLLTTANFSAKSKVLSWFIGGLNRQIEHHLFPHICHIHYKKIAPLVKETAKEYDLPYYEQGTFVSALLHHGKMLKMLGKSA